MSNEKNWLLRGLWLLCFSVGVTVQQNASDPSSNSTNTSLPVPTTVPDYTNVTLRVAVVSEPPMVMDAEDGSGLTGFQLDLLKSIREIANRTDGVQLNLEIHDMRSAYRPAVAFDLVASNCHSNSSKIKNKTDCDRFDLLLSPVFATPDRFERADLTPPFQQGYLTAVRYSEAPLDQQYFTFADLERAENGTICGNANSLIVKTIIKLYPGLQVFGCKGAVPGPGGCIDPLKAGNCSLQVGFFNTLTYATLLDPSLILIQEALRKGYNIWSMPYALDETVRSMVKKWMYAAVNEGVADDLFTKYYEATLCPLGWAGHDFVHAESHSFRQ